MKYAKEVITLLAAYPHRSFAMRDIVRYIDPKASPVDKQRIRVGVLRVLGKLAEMQQVKIVNQKHGEPRHTRYSWQRDT